MLGRLLSISAIGRAIGLAVVAIVIIAATLHFRAAPSRDQHRRADLEAASDPLATELRRCQVIATQAKDDAACEAAWAESRRRFFTYRPAPGAAAAPAAAPNSLKQ